ncbi:MAG: PEP-CTERM sorting domain-containing protein [Myxococcota bacterium]
MGRRRGSLAIALGLALGLAGALLPNAEGRAAQAQFNSGWGLDPAGLGGLPVASIDASTPFLTAGETGSAAGLDIELSGSTALCVIGSNASLCRAANPPLSGAFSVLVSFTVHVNDPSITGPFTLMLTSLVGGQGYAPGDVAIDLAPPVPASLDTSAVPGFVWSGGFTPFVHVRDLSAAPTVYDYVGWTVQEGSRVTFRYVLPSGLKGGAYPAFTANAVPLVVPEPGAVVLMALGLAGLAAGSRRADF